MLIIKPQLQHKGEEDVSSFLTMWPGTLTYFKMENRMPGMNTTWAQQGQWIVPYIPQHPLLQSPSLEDIVTQKEVTMNETNDLFTAVLYHNETFCLKAPAPLSEWGLSHLIATLITTFCVNVSNICTWNLSEWSQSPEPSYVRMRHHLILSLLVSEWHMTWAWTSLCQNETNHLSLSLPVSEWDKSLEFWSSCFSPPDTQFSA